MIKSLKLRLIGKALMVLVILLIAGLVFVRSSLYNKVLGINYSSKSVAEETEELRKSYLRDIEGDVFFITTLLLTDSLDNPESFIMLNREFMLVEPSENAISAQKDQYIEYYTKYRYKDASGNKIIGAKCMNFDKNLNFLGVGERN